MATHLSHFVGTGEIDINFLIPPAKQAMIKTAVEKNGIHNLRAIVGECNQEVSYGEVKLLAATLKKEMY